MGGVDVPDFGWGGFAGEPEGYRYVYLRDSKSAYGKADRVDLVRVPKGKVADLAAWQVFAGGPAAPPGCRGRNVPARRPVLTDPGRINRPHVSYLGGCWTMAVTMPGTGAGRPAQGWRSTRRSSPTGRGTAGLRDRRRPGRERAVLAALAGRAAADPGRPVRVAQLRHGGRLLSRAAPARSRAGVRGRADGRKSGGSEVVTRKGRAPYGGPGIRRSFHHRRI